MTKLELEAVRSLPRKYVRDGTLVCEFLQLVIAAHTKLPMIAYHPKTKKWKQMTV